MVESIKNLVQNMDIGSITIIILALIVIILLYIFRKTPVVIKIITEGIEEAEQSLNGEKGQEKLDVAVNYIQSKTPFVLRFLVTKSALVTLIELLLKFGVNKVLGVEKTIDIIGNENDIVTSVNAEIKDNITSFDVEVGKGSKIDEDSDSYIYGAVKGETDFHGNDKASVEIGIRKEI